MASVDDVTDEELRRMQFHRLHTEFMRAEGFTGWEWPIEVSYCHADLFEEWLIERWLRHIRSEAFRETAEYHYLRAEWEREG
jgi:hypothetical protein